MLPVPYMTPSPLPPSCPPSSERLSGRVEVGEEGLAFSEQQPQVHSSERGPQGGLGEERHEDEGLWNPEQR